MSDIGASRLVAAVFFIVCCSACSTKSTSPPPAECNSEAITLKHAEIFKCYDDSGTKKMTFSVGQSITCMCQHRCLNVTVHCDSPGQWNTSACQVTTRYFPDKNLNITITDSKVTYFCTPGFILQGTSSLVCSNNQLNGTEPSCIAKPAKYTGVLIGIGSSFALVAFILMLYCSCRHCRNQAQMFRVDNLSTSSQNRVHQDHMTMNELYVSFNSEFNNVRKHRVEFDDEDIDDDKK